MVCPRLTPPKTREALHARVEADVVTRIRARVRRGVLIEEAERARLGRIEVVDRDGVAGHQRVGELIRRVVGIVDEQVVAPDEILVVAAEIAERHRRARHDLALHADVGLELPGPLDIRGEVLARLDAEGRGERREVDLAAGGPIRAGHAGPVRQVVDRALRDVVAVQVVPGQRRTAVEIRIVRFREAAAVGPHVFAGAELDRGLAVALDVPREPEARRHVVPVRHVLPILESAERHEAARRDAPSLDRAVEMLEPYAWIDGESPERPRVLRVDAGIGVHVRPRILRRVVDDHLRRVLDLARWAGHRPIKLNQIGGLAALPPEITEPVLQADLERVRAGHIGRRGDDRLADRFAVIDAAVIGAEGGLQVQIAARDDVLGALPPASASSSRC